MAALVDYRGVQILSPAPVVDAGLALHDNFKALADRIGICNYLAITDPGPTNDISEDYTVGSLWLNNSSDEVFFCTDNTNGAAVWSNLSTGSSGGGGDSVPTSRIIGTAPPLTGGGNLSTNLNLGITTAGPSSTGALTGADWLAFASKAPGIHGHAAGDISGIMALVQGGTAANSALGARTNLLPSKVGNSNKLLRVNTAETDYELVNPSTQAGVPYVDVTQSPYNVVGDGIVNDSPGIQAAVNAVIGTGGILWFPPGKNYCIGTKIVIKSRFPVFLKSAMVGGGPGGGAGTSHAETAIVRPIANLDYMFEWTTPDGLLWGEGGGGGIEGFHICDWTEPLTARFYTLTAAINVHTNFFRLFETTINWIKGSAIRFGTTIYSTMRNIKIYNCGSNSRPPIDIDGGGSNAQVWIDRAFIESCNDQSTASWIRVNAGCLMDGRSLYFEAGAAGGLFVPPGPFVDGTDGGRYTIDGGWFHGTEGKSLVVGAPDTKVFNSVFISHPQANPTIHILSPAVCCQFANLRIFRSGSGRNILNLGSNNQFSNIYLGAGGGIDTTAAANCVFSNIYIYLTAENVAGPYIIDLGSNELNGGMITGNLAAACHGVRTVAGAIRSFTVHSFVNSNAFTATGSLAQIVGCRAYSIGTGQAFVLTFGNVASANYGYPTTAVATAGAATLNTESGTIETESLTTAPGGTYVLTLTNAMIIASSRVFASVSIGTGETVRDYQVKEVLPSTGVVFISIKNTGASNFTGTIKISFWVIN